MSSDRILIVCTHCMAKLKAPAKVLGTTVMCPGCKRNFRVLAESDESLTPELDHDQLPTSEKAPPPSAPQPENPNEIPLNFECDLDALDLDALGLPDTNNKPKPFPAD